MKTNVMKSEKEILEEIERIKSDERLSYPPADVRINAPLALIQTSMTARLLALEWALGMP